MNSKKIFITGASGCIGHYLVETLIQQTNHELYLLVRNPDKLRIDSNARPGIHILESDLREISRWKDILKTTNVAILAATAWGGTQEVFDINVINTIKLLTFLNPEVCEQVLYFSTASVLDRHNELLKEANQFGTDYIRSKYEVLYQISRMI
jgi:nucleoside-diphosphate-sugar epimerase